MPPPRTSYRRAPSPPTAAARRIVRGECHEQKCNLRQAHGKTRHAGRSQRIWEKYVRDYVAGSDGTLSYSYCYDDNDPDVVIAFQLAPDQASGQEFVKQPWFADYQRETAALLAGPSEIRTATPQWVKGAA
jgi:quinol monooxygenase YgiN